MNEEIRQPEGNQGFGEPEQPVDSTQPIEHVTSDFGAYQNETAAYPGAHTAYPAGQGTYPAGQESAAYFGGQEANYGFSANQGYNQSFGSDQYGYQHPFYPTGASYYGTPAAGMAVPPPPSKPKHKWSTAALAISAAVSLLLGGLIGGGIGAEIQEHITDSQSLYGDGNYSPTLPESGSNGWDSDSAAVDSGTKVDSAPGVVLINTKLSNSMGAGTGMIIDKSGTIVTNYHVVSDSETVVVTIADTNKEYEANVVGHDATHDIAVLQIKDGSNFDTVSINKNKIAKGDAVAAVGNGSGQGYLTRLEGNVTALDQTITAQESGSSSKGEKLNGLIETDADVVSGYSGGPLLDSKGKVVGITTAASMGNMSSDILGYAIPISDAMDIADKILAGESSDTIVIGRDAALGVMISDGPNGVTIAQVLSGSGAEAAGLTSGDIITSIDGETIRSAESLSTSIRSHSVGDSVEVGITKTDGTTTTAQVKLGESSVN